MATVETITARVRTLCNEALAGMVSDDQILVFINAALREIARRGYFKKETSLDAEEAVSAYDLTEITDLIQILSVRWYDDDDVGSLEPLRTWEDYRRLVATESTSTSGSPENYFIQTNTVYVWPAPTADTDDALIFYHTYMPEELEDGDDAPPTPPAYDDLYVHYALHSFFARDFTSPDSQRMGQYHYNAFAALLSDLLNQGRSVAPAVVPYR